MQGNHRTILPSLVPPLSYCLMHRSESCPVLRINWVNPSVDENYLFLSLKAGHYECCNYLLTHSRKSNPELYKNTEVITNLLRENRSRRVVPALKLLLDFNFPVDVKAVSELEFQDGIPFSEGVTNLLLEHGIDITPTRFSSTKSAR